MDDDRVQLLRGSIGHDAGVDVTWKSANDDVLELAPNRQDAWLYRRGRIDWDVYSGRYRQKLQDVCDSVFEGLYWLGMHPGARSAQRVHQLGTVYLLCYCRPDKWLCHVDVLINYCVEHYPELFCRTRVVLPDLSAL